MVSAFAEHQAASGASVAFKLLLSTGGTASPPPMKRLLLVHNLVQGQSVVHELDDKDFAVELVEGDPETNDQGEMDVESRFFIRVDND